MARRLRRGFLPLLLLAGAGCAGLTDKPDLSQPIPAIALRVGLYVSPAVRDFQEYFMGNDVKIPFGSMLASETEVRFGKVFKSVTPVHHLPPDASEAAGLDALVVLERPRFDWEQPGMIHHKLKLTLLFVLCNVKGNRIDALEESAGVGVTADGMPWQIEAAFKEAIDLITRASIHHFLLKAPEFMNRRY